MLNVPNKDDFEFEEYEKWIKSLFDGDPLAYILAYQIFEAMKDKRMTGIGVIVEKEGEPIQDSEIAKLSLHLMEKGLQFNRKHDKM